MLGNITAKIARLEKENANLRAKYETSQNEVSEVQARLAAAEKDRDAKSSALEMMAVSAADGVKKLDVVNETLAVLSGYLHWMIDELERLGYASHSKIVEAKRRLGDLDAIRAAIGPAAVDAPESDGHKTTNPSGEWTDGGKTWISEDDRPEREQYP